MSETTETRDLGFLATVTAYCDSHQEHETWGVKGATAAEARDRIALAQEGIMGDHRLRQYIPSVGKIYALPIRQPEPPEPDPIEKATSAVHAEVEHLSHDDRLLVLRMAIKAEWQDAGILANLEEAEGLVPIPRCDGGQIP